MTEQVVFVNGKRDVEIACDLYGDSPAFRVSLFNLGELSPLLADDVPLWLDASVDAMHHWSALTAGWKRFFAHFSGAEDVATSSFQAKPTKSVVQGFVDEVLNACFESKPAWLSVPQFPHEDGVGKNKINRALADATGVWARDSGYRGKLILPFILTHRRQSDRKAARTQKLNQAVSCLERAGADGIWVVDSSLQDQLGSDTFRDRFESLVALHAELAEAAPKAAPIVAGPYWGLGLVLWVRGFISHPAVGAGSGYRYMIPGTPLRNRKRRIAIPAIRRWAVASPELRGWLGEAAEEIPAGEDAHRQLKELQKRFTQVSQGAKRQVATFHRKWTDSIERHPKAGRPFALYQDLSTAFVLGRLLPRLPETENPGWDPAKVAQQLMMRCL